MPFTYRDGKSYIWRDGIPRVTESYFDVRGSRSSGLYGTGVYAYLSAGRLLASKSEEFYAIDVSDKKFLKVKHLDDLIDLSREMIDWVTAVLRKTGTSELRKRSFKYAKRVGVYNEGMFFPSAVENAIENAVRGIDGSCPENASQPINFLLIQCGYDGIEPHYSAANSNQFGIVIFREMLGTFARTYQNLTTKHLKYQKVERNSQFIKSAMSHERRLSETIYNAIESPQKYAFSENARIGIYFATQDAMKAEGVKYDPLFVDDEDRTFLDYQEKVVSNKKIMKAIFDKAELHCIEHGKDPKLCKSIRRHESKEYVKG